MKWPQSSIEWTEITWNPTTGCNKVSAGCKYCYAEVMAHRLQGMGVEKYKDGVQLALFCAVVNERPLKPLILLDSCLWFGCLALF